MKNRMAIMIALSLGITCCVSGVEAKATDTNDVSVKSGSVCRTDMNEDDGKEEAASDKELLSDADRKEQPPQKDGEEQSPETEKENTGLSHLQIPNRLEVVIDPWEMDGYSQIYSKEYYIRNTGDCPGILTLSNLACTPQSQSEVIVKTDPAGIHDDEEKSVYMQMVLDGDEQIVLSREEACYQTELQPGEELSIWFQGEVNEYAKDEWRSSDLAIQVKYSWEMKEILSEPDIELDINDDKSEEIERPDDGSTFKEKIQDSQENLPGVDEIVWITDERDEVKSVDLQDIQKSEIVADSWQIDEDGQYISAQYVIRNIGEQTGVLTLLNLACKTEEESDIEIQYERKSLHDSENKAVYVELHLENGERIIPTLENEEEDVCEVELKPGEELVVWFLGEIKGLETEQIEAGNIMAMADFTWNPKE